MPGITPAVIAFADEVVERGQTVVLPDLAGTPGRAPTLGYLAGATAKACIAREFTTWAVGQTSPIVGWLRALARAVHAECGGPGVGAVGMCFSGGFALGMLLDDVTIAPVLAQPALPIAVGAARRADLGLSPDDAAVIADRAAAGCDVLGLRFRDDALVGDRFDTLRDLLGDAFVAVELPSPYRRAHSILAEDRDDAAVAQVLDFLAERLQPDGDADGDPDADPDGDPDADPGAGPTGR